MEIDASNGAIPPPRARPFPVTCDADKDVPGLRCGHTLTAITPEKNPSAARLVMFGETWPTRALPASFKHLGSLIWLFSQGDGRGLPLNDRNGETRGLLS